MLKNYPKTIFVITYIGIFVAGIFLGILLCANMSALKSELSLQPSSTTEFPPLPPLPKIASHLAPPQEIPLPSSPLPEPTEEVIKKMQEEMKKTRKTITGKIKFITSCDAVNRDENCVGSVGNVTLVILDQNGKFIRSLRTDENGEAEIDLTILPDMRFHPTNDPIGFFVGTINVVAIKEGYREIVIYDVEISPNLKAQRPIPMRLKIGNLRLDEPIGYQRDFHRLEIGATAERAIKSLEP